MIGILHAQVLAICRWLLPTKSRWLTLFRGTQVLVAALGLGFEGWITVTLEDESLATEYYVSGVKSLDVEVKQFAVLAATCGWPTEQCVVSLMQDDSLAARMEELSEVKGVA